MAIYPPTSSRVSTLEQPKWTDQSTSENRVNYIDAITSNEDHAYEASPNSNQTLAGSLKYHRLLSESDVVREANEQSQVDFVVQVSRSICAYRALAQEQ